MTTATLAPNTVTQLEHVIAEETDILAMVRDAARIGDCSTDDIAMQQHVLDQLVSLYSRALDGEDITEAQWMGVF